ncbi:hypothetical protein Tco_0134821 [Tanacetum coccineum]
MEAFESCPKHNMIAYLEKIDGNTEFHEIMDFLTRSSIYYALTTISEASIRSDLLFDDADGIDTLNNQAIFDTIQLMGTSWDQIPTNIATVLKNVPVPLDHFPINALTSIELKPDPSPRPSPSIPIPDSNPEGSGGNHGGQSSSDRSLSGNEDGLTLQSVYDLCISLCK